MSEVIRVESSNVKELIEGLDWAHVGQDAYLRTIRLPWIDHERPYLYVLVNGKTVVGAIQTIYAHRHFAGGACTVGNLSTWWVKEEFRSHSLRLLSRMRADVGGIPVTALTASPVAILAYRSLGFTTVDDQRFSIDLSHKQGDEANDDALSIFLQANPIEKQIANDHAMFDVHHLQVERGGSRCRLIYRIRDRDGVVVADALSVRGDPTPLLGPWRPPRDSKLAHARVLLIDKRFFRDEPSGLPLFNPEFPRPRMLLGPSHLGPEVDYLYSEVCVHQSSLG
jgi:hypothetical protein